MPTALRPVNGGRALLDEQDEAPLRRTTDSKYLFAVLRQEPDGSSVLRRPQTSFQLTVSDCQGINARMPRSTVE